MLDLNQLKTAVHSAANQTRGVIELNLAAIKRLSLAIDEACGLVFKSQDDYVVSRSARGRFHVENTRLFVELLGQNKVRDHIIVIKQELETPARMQALEVIKTVCEQAVFVYADKPSIVKKDKPNEVTAPFFEVVQQLSSKPVELETPAPALPSISSGADPISEHKLRLFSQAGIRKAAMTKKYLEAQQNRKKAAVTTESKPVKDKKGKTKVKQTKNLTSLLDPFAKGNEDLLDMVDLPTGVILEAPKEVVQAGDAVEVVTNPTQLSITHELPAATADALGIKSGDKIPVSKLDIYDFTITELVKFGGYMVLGVVQTTNEYDNPVNWLIQSAMNSPDDSPDTFYMTVLDIHPMSLTAFSSMETESTPKATKVQLVGGPNPHIRVLGWETLKAERGWIGGVSINLHADLGLKAVHNRRQHAAKDLHY